MLELRDGWPTCIRTSQNIFSAIDITMVSAEIASVSGWEIMDQHTMGSDILIVSKFGRCLLVESDYLSLGLKN